MSGLYADYLKERRGLSMIESDQGFIAYRCKGKECFIGEMYVDPDVRKLGVGRKLLNTVIDVARAEGCEFITANIFLDDPNANSTLAAVLACGFKVVSAPNSNVLFISLQIGGL